MIDSNAPSQEYYPTHNILLAWQQTDIQMLTQSNEFYTSDTLDGRFNRQIRVSCFSWAFHQAWSVFVDYTSVIYGWRIYIFIVCTLICVVVLENTIIIVHGRVNCCRCTLLELHWYLTRCPYVGFISQKVQKRTKVQQGIPFYFECNLCTSNVNPSKCVARVTTLRLLSPSIPCLISFNANLSIKIFQIFSSNE